ncbi:MAG: efflux RND transporter periplasmic adaptor subunit, partial [Pyrinomonadaceae bacterium]
MAVSRKKKLIIGIVAFVVVAVVVIVSIRAARKDIPEVETVTIETRPELRSTVTASGEVRPGVYVNQTSEVAGRIEEIYVKEGESVTKGKPLVRLDPTQLQSNQDAQVAAVQASMTDIQNARNAVLSAEQALNVQESAIVQARQEVISSQTSVDRAQVDLDTANRELRRTTELLESGVSSKADFDAAQDKRKQGEVSLRTAQANLAAQKQNVQQSIARRDQQRAAVNEARTSIKTSEARASQQQAILRGQTSQRDKSLVLSPIDGVIAEIPSKVGTFAVAGLSTTALLTIADMSTINVEVKVDETEIDKVAVGQMAKVKVDAFTDKEIIGKVTQKTPLAVVKSGSTGGLSNQINTQEAKEFRVVIQLENVPDEIKNGLKPGMSATATITTKSQPNVIAVPLQAIVEKQPDKPTTTATPNGSLPAADKPKAPKGVYIIEKGKVKFIPVTTGITGESDIEVTSGVTAGMEVIKGPSRVLKNLK